MDLLRSQPQPQGRPGQERRADQKVRAHADKKAARLTETYLAGVNTGKREEGRHHKTSTFG
ncbi:hypothetical protein EON65_51645 [archaeon]|nr:MAG: hypothetical protein EON65_51645 [archaeon]